MLILATMFCSAHRPAAALQLKTDIHYIFHTLSGLHPRTHLLLSWLPVSRDMEEGLALLAGFHKRERLQVGEEEEMIQQRTSVERELGRMVDGLKPLAEIASLNKDDWKICQ